MVYKVDEAIQVTYKSKKSVTGLTVKLDVFDETGTLDATKSIAAMAEPNTDGVYVGTFTPDAQGEWLVYVYEDGKADEKVIEQYSVGGYNLDDIGQALGDIGSPPMIG